jgi:hypothetical protein
MSWQARIMGIADIFEALTAKDRPYKEGMTLSQALVILEAFQPERPHRRRPARHLRQARGLSALRRGFPESLKQIDC